MQENQESQEGTPVEVEVEGEEQLESMDKTYSFRLYTDDEGIKVHTKIVDDLKDGEIVGDSDIVDIAIVLLSITKMLKDSGLPEDELKGLFANVAHEAFSADDDIRKSAMDKVMRGNDDDLTPEEAAAIEDLLEDGRAAIASSQKLIDENS